MPEHTLTFRSDEQTLAGTLTVPPGTGPFPTVLLLPGSGPLDRNSDHKRLPLGITGQLASAMGAAGVVTFRYDKRGVGASTGRWHAAGFYDNRGDARAALDFLATRPEVDPARMIVLGHSEGALHAAGLAADGTPAAGGSSSAAPSCRARPCCAGSQRSSPRRCPALSA